MQPEAVVPPVDRPTIPSPGSPAAPAAGKRGVAVDIDGTLVSGGVPITGARETIDFIRQAGLELVLVSNHTMAPRLELVRRLRRFGLEVEPNEVMTAATATVDYLNETFPSSRVFLVAEGEPFREGDLKLVDAGADVAVLGGAGPVFVAQLDLVLQELLDGAEFVAMHANITQRTKQGIGLDTGAFLPGLEAASGRQATVVGKPAPLLFEKALASKALKPTDAIMVGDDLFSDVLAAQALGMTGVQVKTGKYNAHAAARADGAPDFTIDSIAELPTLLGQYGVTEASARADAS
jgi:HAD superfamily hydrolase (TIGR01458 family)